MSDPMYRMSPELHLHPHEIWVPAGIQLTDEQIRDAWTLWNLAFAEKGQKLNGKS